MLLVHGCVLNCCCWLFLVDVVGAGDSLGGATPAAIAFVDVVDVVGRLSLVLLLALLLVMMVLVVSF